MSAETQGDMNVAIGVGALQSQNNTSDSDVFNVGVGHNAGNDITTGVKNQLIGGRAGDALTVGSFNTAMGTDSLGADTQGNRSVAIGHGTLTTQNFTSATDTYNTAVGFGAGNTCLLYTSPSPRDGLLSRMPSSA